MAESREQEPRVLRTSIRVEISPGESPSVAIARAVANAHRTLLRRYHHLPA